MTSQLSKMEAVGALGLLFVVGALARSGKHVYVRQKLTWPNARSYCTQHHTDLAAITTPWEEEKLMSATAGEAEGLFWIGLSLQKTRWTWVGQAEATYVPWSPGQPDGNEVYVCVCWHKCGRISGWHDAGSRFPFLCLNLVVVEDAGSWEEALDHCRKKHTTLTSLVSRPENMAATREIQRQRVDGRAWIGLRFLGDRWLWVNGDPLTFQAWSEGDEARRRCPTVKRCGALTKGGVWESVDCLERLSFICY